MHFAEDFYIELTTLFVSYDRVALRWRLGVPVLAPVTFEVLISENAVTGYEVIERTEAVALIKKLALGSKFKPHYFKVRAEIDGREIISNTASLAAPPNEDVLRLQRRERFKLSKYDGVPALLYTRRRSGEPCPRCVTNNAHQGDFGINCRICYGTGIKDGYYLPLPIYVAAQVLKSEGTRLTDNKVTESSNTNLWTSNWSIVSPEDVIIEMTPPNLVWQVTGVQRTERRRSPVRQLITANEPDKGHVLAQLPITAFEFPAPSEIYMFDFEDGKDFDAIFQERLDVYLANQSVRQQEVVRSKPAQRADQQPRKRNPAAGYSA